jgi:hypothetical protein
VQIDQHTEGKTGEEVMREGGEIVERKSLRRTPTATSYVQTTTLKKEATRRRTDSRSNNLLSLDAIER